MSDKIINTCIAIRNYETESLKETLTMYGNGGFSLVSTLMTKNEYGVDVMYLFFTKAYNNVGQIERSI